VCACAYLCVFVCIADDVPAATATTATTAATAFTLCVHVCLPYGVKVVKIVVVVVSCC